MNRLERLLKLGPPEEAHKKLTEHWNICIYNALDRLQDELGSTDAMNILTLGGLNLTEDENEDICSLLKEIKIEWRIEIPIEKVRELYDESEEG